MIHVTRHDDGSTTITKAGQGELTISAETWEALTEAARAGKLDPPAKEDMSSPDGRPPGRGSVFPPSAQDKPSGE